MSMKHIYAAYPEIYRNILKRFDAVIGLTFASEAGEGFAAGSSGDGRLVAFVERPSDKERLPGNFEGFPLTARVPVLSWKGREGERDAEGNSTRCLPDWMFVDGPRLHEINRKRLEDAGRIRPGARLWERLKVWDRDGMVVVEDPKCLLQSQPPPGTPSDALNGFFDEWAAFQALGTNYSRDYDFAMFITSYTQCVDGTNSGNYGKIIHNETEGLRISHIDHRDEWRSDRLQAIQTISQNLSERLFLHELGHRWGAYVKFRRQGEAASDDFHLPTAYAIEDHWGTFFQSGFPHESPRRNSVLDHGNNAYEVDAAGAWQVVFVDSLPDVATWPGFPRVARHPADLPSGTRDHRRRT